MVTQAELEINQKRIDSLIGRLKEEQDITNEALEKYEQYRVIIEQMRQKTLTVDSVSDELEQAKNELNNTALLLQNENASKLAIEAQLASALEDLR